MHEARKAGSSQLTRCSFKKKKKGKVSKSQCTTASKPSLSVSPCPWSTAAIMDSSKRAGLLDRKMVGRKLCQHWLLPYSQLTRTEFGIKRETCYCTEKHWRNSSSLLPTPTLRWSPVSAHCSLLLCLLQSFQLPDSKQDVRTDLAWNCLLTLPHLKASLLCHFRAVVLSCAVNSSLLSLFSSSHRKQHTSFTHTELEFKKGPELLPILTYWVSFSSQMRTWNVCSLLLPGRRESKCNSCAYMKFRISHIRFSVSLNVFEHHLNR